MYRYRTTMKNNCTKLTMGQFAGVEGQQQQLNAYFITGFSDAEGCFYVKISKNKKCLTGWKVELVFIICLHKKDQALLEMIKSSLGGVGNIVKHGKDSIQFKVSSVKGLSVIINHFYKYPLITQKRADYVLFKQAFNLISNKEYLTNEGLQKLVAIKASSSRIKVYQKLWEKLFLISHQ